MVYGKQGQYTHCVVLMTEILSFGLGSFGLLALKCYDWALTEEKLRHILGLVSMPTIRMRGYPLLITDMVHISVVRLIDVNCTTHLDFERYIRSFRPLWLVLWRFLHRKRVCTSSTRLHWYLPSRQQPRAKYASSHVWKYVHCAEKRPFCLQSWEALLSSVSLLSVEASSLAY